MGRSRQDYNRRPSGGPMSRVSTPVLACLAIGAMCATLPAAQTPKVDVVIHAGRLIDGTITAVQDGIQTPAGARVIDLRTATVMPGFIDAHTHITGEGTGNALVRAATE